MKRLTITLTILAFCLCLPAAALAAAPPDLRGTWMGTWNEVYWNGVNGFGSGQITMTVAGQDLASGNFYGTIYGRQMTGNVSTKKMITGVMLWADGEYATFQAQVKGTKISGVWNRFGSGVLDTIQFDLEKQ